MAIKLNSGADTYTLEYNRKSVERMERMGFRTSEIEDMPATMFPLLFSGAFRVNHSAVSNRVIDELYDKVVDKDGLLSKLADMYVETLSTLLEDPAEDEGNVSWEEA